MLGSRDEYDVDSLRNVSSNKIQQFKLTRTLNPADTIRVRNSFVFAETLFIKSDDDVIKSKA